MTEISFTVVLGLAAIIAALIGARAKKGVREYLLFAAALYASLAIGDAMAMLVHLPGEADAIALIVCALAPASLALAITGPGAMPATIILLACLASGIFAVMSGEAFAAFLPLMVSAGAMLAVALPRRRVYALAGALAFIAAAAAFMAGGRIAFMLFSATGLMGLSLSLSHAQVATKRKFHVAPPIGG